MSHIKTSEVSTDQKMDATFSNFLFAFDRGEIDSDDTEFWIRDAEALDDEFFERSCAENPREALEEIDRLGIHVQRGARTVSRELGIEADAQSWLAQQAMTRTGNRAKQAFRLGRAWALSNLPTFSELRLMERRFTEKNERRKLREAKRSMQEGA
jgi:hypothetical protein